MRLTAVALSRHSVCSARSASLQSNLVSDSSYKEVALPLTDSPSSSDDFLNIIALGRRTTISFLV